jgi:hypothetical protein
LHAADPTPDARATASEPPALHSVYRDGDGDLFEFEPV